MSEVPRCEEIVGQYWPVHGPYSPGRVEVAASAIAELVRYLNYATGQGSVQALRYASHVYTVVGGLKAAAGGLDQTLRQLAARTAALSTDPTLGHCQHPEDRHAAEADADRAGQSLDTARHAAAALADALNTAQSHLAWLEHHEPQGAEAGAVVDPPRPRGRDEGER